MYQCLECGESFSKPLTYTDRDEVHGRIFSTTHRECPYCESSDIEEEGYGIY